MSEDKNPVNFEAYFLGPQAENKEFYQELLNRAFEDHCRWRQLFGLGDDQEFITPEDKARPDFRAAQSRIRKNLHLLQKKLESSQPFFSPRYIGHMNWEVMLAPTIAFLSAALYNPNNVAHAGSTATTSLEIEVGRDFSRLFGFDPDKSWGHICTGGTIANMEALWIARNMKAIPLALKETAAYFKMSARPFRIGQRTVSLGRLTADKLLGSFSPTEILDLKDAVLAEIKKKHKNSKAVDDVFENYGLQERGLLWKRRGLDPGVVFLPQTKHYSLKKAMDLLGIGRANIRYVPVGPDFRMDIDVLRKMIFREADRGPILAVIGVMGSTEESAVDRIDEIIAIRDDLRKEKDMSFHLHVDAAYGGYARALFLGKNGRFMGKKELDAELVKFGIIGDKPERSYTSWPHDEVFKAYKALPGADTITVDPHKLGYVLYPAGGVVLRDKRMRESIHTYAPYVFSRPKPGDPDILIGSYILEGSKPGAAAAAVWMAHRIMPLDITGYGKLIGETIDGAQALWYGLQNGGTFPVTKDLAVQAFPVTKPDLNIVNYVFNFQGNKNLDILNELTKYVTKKILGYETLAGEAILEKDFIVSSTDFDYEEYGDSPKPFLSRIGIPAQEWARVKSVKIARSVIMSPYLTADYVDDNYVKKFIDYLGRSLADHKNDLLLIQKGKKM